MKIACLGWGSLIWKPQQLPVAGEWHPDGPKLPIEFSRVGDGGELATAICLNAPLIQVYWAELRVETLPLAILALREREQIPASREDGVGILVLNGKPVGALAQWAAERALDAVIWTALPPRLHHQEGRIPSEDEALAYLDSLEGETRQHAQEYVNQVPKAFETPYRQAIRERLGWGC